MPAEARRRLGLGPGAVLEWDLAGDRIVVRRAGRYESQDVHAARFPDGPPERRSPEEVDECNRRAFRARVARAVR